MTPENKGVLVLYTGGTIGSVPKDANDPDSPRVIASWEKLKEAIPTLDNMGFRVDAHSFNPPIDSSNMKPEYWVEMAKIIEANYDKYEGFVIVHGTDTMVYTASVLSFMLENLEKPVIITGSQIPIAGCSRNDGQQNLVTALLIANPKFSGIPVVSEVCIFFRDQLLRGNRTVKESASGYSAFYTPNYPALGEAGEHIVIHEQFIRKATGRAFTVHKKLHTNVISFLIFPGVQSTPIFADVFKSEDVKGFVLLTYGTGNAPSDEDFLSVIEQATRKEKIVLNVTQCRSGTVELGRYETSAGLLDLGVVSGSDITHEAALCKLMVLLGDEDLRPSEVRERVERNRAGEQSRSIYTTHYTEKGHLKGESRYRFRGEDISKEWNPVILDQALLRLRGAEISAEKSEVVEIAVFVGLGADDALDVTKPNFGGTFVRQAGSDAKMFVFDITRVVKSLLAPGSRTSFTVALKTADAQLKWKEAELVIFTRE